MAVAVLFSPVKLNGQFPSGTGLLTYIFQLMSWKLTIGSEVGSANGGGTRFK